MAWEPAESVAKNEAGQFQALIGGQWVPVQQAAKDAAGKFMVFRDQELPDTRSQNNQPFVPSGEKAQPTFKSEILENPNTPAAIASTGPVRFALGAAKPILGLGQRFNDLWGNKDISERVKQMEEMKHQGGQQGLDVAETTGNVLSPAFLKPAQMIKPATSLVGRTLQAMGFGGAAGLTDTTTDKPLSEAITGATVAGAVPPAAAVAGKTGGMLYHGLVEPWLNPTAIKGRAYLEAAGDKVREIINRLAENKQHVPGSVPTAGEAAAPAGRAEFSALQESASKVKPSDYVERADQQNVARLTALKEFAGSPAKRAEAIANREAKAVPHYEQATGIKPGSKDESPLFIFKDGRAESGRGMDAHGNLLQDLGIDSGDLAGVAKTGRIYTASDKDTIKLIAGKDLYNKQDVLDAAKNYVAKNRPSKSVEVYFDDQRIPIYSPPTGQVADTAGLQTLMERPSSKAVLTRVERLMKEGDKNFQELFPNGLPRNMTGEEAQKLKLAFDDMITAMPKSAMDTNEMEAIKATRGEFVKWAEKSFPELGRGRKLYKMASAPVNEMDTGEELVKRTTTALQEEGGKLKAEPFAKAVRESTTLVKKATGEPRFQNIEDVLSRRSLNTVHDVQTDLGRAARHEQLAREGTSAGPAADILATQNLERQTGGKAPNLLNRHVMLANAIIARLEGRVNKKLASEIATEMLNAPGVAKSLAEAQTREERNKLITDAIRRWRTPLVAGAESAAFQGGN